MGKLTRDRSHLTPIAKAVSEIQGREIAGIRIEDVRAKWIEKHLRPEVVDEVLREYGVGKRLRELEIADELVPVECAQWLRLAREGANLILAGPPGSGKTTAAVWCLRELYEARVSRGAGAPRANFVKMRDLFAAVFAKDRVQLDRAERADVLVLDDWGTAYEHAWPMAELDALIDRRWEDARPTIVTTNMHPETGDGSLRETLPRSYDRLTGEPGPGAVVIDRPSLRQRGTHS